MTVVKEHFRAHFRHACNGFHFAQDAAGESQRAARMRRGRQTEHT
jgi:hypothetical protein